MRKMITLLVTLALLLILAVPAWADARENTAVFTIGSTTYTVNGVARQMDVAPVIVDGRTLLPIRYVAYGMGIPDKDIQYMTQSRVPGYSQDEEVDITQKVYQPPYANYAETTIILYNNDLAAARIVIENDNTQHFGTNQLLILNYGVPPQVINGRLMMPLRAISGLTPGVSLAWNGTTDQVTITAPVVSDAD